MDPLFESYFRERVNQLWLSPSGIRPERGGITDRVDLEAHNMARSAVEGAHLALDRTDRRLRGDAELLLYLAFAELVARPVVAVRGDAGDLPTAMGNDIELITQTAARIQERGGPISAHRIIDVTSDLWSRLQSARWGLWD